LAARFGVRSNVRIWFSVLVIGIPIGAQSAESLEKKDAPQRQTGARTELTTTTGDHLTGRALRLDCRGLSFLYLGNSLQVPLDKIAALTSEDEVLIRPGNGKDRIVGKLNVKAAIVAITTHDLGKLEMPITAFRCNGKTSNDGAFAGHDITKTSASAHADGEDQFGSATVAPQSLAGSRQPARKMAAIPGKGIESAGQNQADWNTDAASPSSAPPTADPIPGAKPASSSENGTPRDGGAKPDSELAAPATPASPPIPKEQREESERNMLEFLRNEVVLVQPRKIEADFSVAYLHTSQQIGNERVVIGGAQGRYGFFEGFEGFLAIPYVWGQRQTNEFSTTVTSELAGIGDLRFGVKYNLVQESQGIPVVVVGASSVAPTGHHPYTPPLTVSSGAAVQGDIRSPIDIQIGTGHWQVIGSVTALKSNDPLVLYATINYSHFIPATYYGVRIAIHRQ
jgi:Putative MetA-pathway of phenol degradation